MQISGKQTFKYQPYWYSGVTYSDEYRRGFDCREDLFVPGTFSLDMKKGDSVVFSASVNEINPKGLKRKFTDTLKKLGTIDSYHDLLAHNAELFKVEKGGKERINAGFSWLETGLLRETVASLPGLTLYANGDCDEFEKILDTLIEDEQERLFRRTTQCEAPLRLTDTIQQYIRFSGRERQIWKKYGETLKGIIESYAPGRRKEVTMHPNGLLWTQMDGVALSWMNAYVHGRPVTERAGYQVETNAFWYNALCFAVDMENKYGPKNSDFVAKWAPVRDLVKENFQPTFWRADWGYLVDYVNNGWQDQAVRPNQLFAISLEYVAVDDEVISYVVKTINDELVTRRGLRSLSPRNPVYILVPVVHDPAAEADDIAPDVDDRKHQPVPEPVKEIAVFSGDRHQAGVPKLLVRITLAPHGVHQVGPAVRGVADTETGQHIFGHSPGGSILKCLGPHRSVQLTVEKPGRFLVQCPKPLLLAVAGLVLLVLRDLHSRPLGQRPDGIGIRKALDLHLEIDDAAALVAAEAIVDSLVRGYGKRRGLLPMEGAQTEKVGTGTLQGNVLTHHVFNWIASRQLVEKCRWESHSPPPFLSECKM